MKKLLLFLLLAISANSTGQTITLQTGAPGWVYINGQRYASGQVMSVYRYNAGANDSLVTFLYVNTRTALPGCQANYPYGVPASSVYNLNAGNTAFGSMLAVMQWDSTNLQPYIMGATTATNISNTATSTAATATSTASTATSTAQIATNTGNIPAQGQAAMSASIPVTLASNQTTIIVADTNSQLQYTTAYRAMSTGVGTDKALIKGSAGNVIHVSIINAPTIAIRYVKLYNAASGAAVTVGSTTPAYTLCASGVSVTQANTGEFDFPRGIYFSAGIVIAIVTTMPDAGNTSVGANDVQVVVSYK